MQSFLSKTKLLIILVQLLYFTSCVSLKKHKELQRRVDKLESRPYLQIEDIDNDGVINYYDSDIDGDQLVNSKDADMDGDGILNFKDKCPLVFGQKKILWLPKIDLVKI